MESFTVGMRQIRGGGADMETVERTSQDLPFKVSLIGAGLIIVLLAVVPQAFGSIENFAHRAVAALCVAIFAFFFVTVSSRIVGLVGVTSNPTSGMTIAALLGTSSIFFFLGWTDNAGKMAALTVGTVVAIAASIAGDMSQDLKTGYLLGATPRRQQIAEIIGVLTSAVFVCLAVMLLDRAYGFGTKELPAPQATLMKLVIDGVLENVLPWTLVAIGVAIAIVAALFRLPVLAFAVGVYLPVATMVPIFLGGLLRHVAERRAANDEERASRKEQGILLGSGLVGGEGLVGVAIAGVAFYLGRPPEGIGYEWAGAFAQWIALAAFGFLAFWFWRTATAKQSGSQSA
jgi:putative OPT family oligopeptide transporter